MRRSCVELQAYVALHRYGLVDRVHHAGSSSNDHIATAGRRHRTYGGADRHVVSIPRTGHRNGDFGRAAAGRSPRIARNLGPSLGTVIECVPMMIRCRIFCVNLAAIYRAIPPRSNTQRDPRRRGNSTHCYLQSIFHRLNPRFGLLTEWSSRPGTRWSELPPARRLPLAGDWLEHATGRERSGDTGDAEHEEAA